MSELSCRDARLDLQAIETLDVLEAQRLNRHLAFCDECAAYRAEQTATDHLIRHQLGASAAQTSVRVAVLSRLAATERPPRTSRSRRGATRISLRALGVAALALAATFIGLWPHMTGHTPGVTPAAAAWHVQRPGVGFPLTVDPRDPNHLLAGAFGQIYASRDAGRSWRLLAPLPRGYVIRDLAIDAAHPTHYLVAAKRTIFLSTDRGRHWHIVARDMLGIENMFLVQDRTHPAHFYAGPSIVWTSTDSGRIWRQDGHGYIFAPDGIQSLTLGPGGTLYAGIWGGGIGISRDGGRTWHRLVNGLAPNVMDVAMGKGTALWAATDRGVYRSTDDGASWQHRGPRFFATSVSHGNGYILAAGKGALYRSTDGGRHWTPAMAGLPLDPYVYSLVRDSAHPNRVFASLDGDGIFRTDDGGQRWQAVDAGLPIAGRESRPHSVLFLRHGALWITTGHGVDPGVLTVDRTVEAAALSPDSASAAYVAGNGSGWAVRVVGAGGSLARTLLPGHGSLPALLWSPTAARLAVVAGRTVTAVNAAGAPEARSWALAAGERVLGWNHDGSALLTWSRRSGRVTERESGHGRILAAWPGRFSSEPLLAPGGTGVAWLNGSRLSLAANTGAHHAVASVGHCSLLAWSDDGTRLLLSCSRQLQMRAASGRLIAAPRLPRNARFAPGSHSALLYYRHGALWRWSRAGNRRIVADAGPV